MRVARALGTLPQLGQALRRGELSYSKVRALTRVATPETAKRHATRTLYLFPDDDGMVVIRGRLEPEVGALLMKALEAARETLYQQARRHAAGPENVPAGTPTDVPARPWAPRVDEEIPTAGQLQADALALIAESTFHHGVNPGAYSRSLRPGPGARASERTPDPCRRQSCYARSSQTLCMSMRPAGIIWKSFTCLAKTFCSLACRTMATGASSRIAFTASS